MRVDPKKPSRSVSTQGRGGALVTAPWISKFFAFADLSTSTLRASLATFSMFGVLSKQRDAIAHELAVRAWAEAVEVRMSTTIAWCRGGRS